MKKTTGLFKTITYLVIFCLSSISLFSQNAKKEISFEPFIWPSSPPGDCPFEKSEDIVGIIFTGKCSDYRLADTWYFSWAADDKLYSPFTDGSVPRLDGSRDLSTSYAPPFTTGQAVAEGDNPLNFRPPDLAQFSMSHYLKTSLSLVPGKTAS